MRDQRWHVDVLMPEKLSVYRASEDEARRYYRETNVGGSIITVKLFDAQYRLVAAKSQFERANYEERTPPMSSDFSPQSNLFLPRLSLPFEGSTTEFRLYSHTPEKFLNIFTKDGSTETRIGTLQTAELHKLRDYLNSLELLAVPPAWSGETVTSLERLLELADEVGDGGGEDFLQFVREFRKWRLTQQ